MDEQPDRVAESHTDEIIRTNKPGRRLGAMVSVRLTPDEDAAVREEAERRGVSISELVRSALLREVGLGHARTMPINRPAASNVPETQDIQVHVGTAPYSSFFVSLTSGERVA